MVHRKVLSNFVCVMDNIWFISGTRVESGVSGAALMSCSIFSTNPARYWHVLLFNEDLTYPKGLTSSQVSPVIGRPAFSL